MDNKLEKLTAALAPTRPPRAIASAPATTLLEFPEPARGFSLRDFWRLLQARRGVVTATILTALVAAAVYNYWKTPTYLAAVSIQIDREQPNIARLDEELSRLPERPDYIETQYKVLKSRTLARRVIERLDLARVPELTRGFRPPPAERPAPFDGVPGVHPRLVDAFLARLRVEPGKGTRLVNVSFESEDPTLAPAAANALADEYIEHNLEAKWNATQKASGWLQQQLASLQDALEASETELHEYAARHSILFVEERKDITTEKLARLENELTVAQSERIEKQSLALLTEAAVRGGPELPAQLTSGALQDLRNKRIDLRQEQQKLLVSFGPSYPRVVRVEREIEEVERSIEEENQRLLSRVREEFQLAQGREALLLEAAGQQRGLVNLLSDDFIQYDILKREAESNRQLYEGLLQRLKEAGVSAGLRASNIAVLDPAEAPERPNRPRPLINLLFALLSGSVLGVVFAFAADHLNTRVRTPDEVERLTGLDLLAVLPRRKALAGSVRARLRIARGAVSVSIGRPKQSGAVLGPLTEAAGATLHSACSSSAADSDGSSRESDRGLGMDPTSSNGAGTATEIATVLTAGDSIHGGANLVVADARQNGAEAPEAGRSMSPLPPLRGSTTSNGHAAASRVWDAEAGLSEAYRTLRSSILLGWEGGLRRLLITSAQPQEGKTTVSLNLACSLAQLGRNVLLIDADMRRPNCARQLGVKATHGLSAYLRGAVDFDSLLAATPINHLSLIHAGSAEAFASDLLCSPRLAELLDEAARRFDHVVIDSPPSLVLSDARTISRLVEGVILVVSDETDRGALLRTKQTFDDAGVRLVGFVMNRVDLADLDYGYYRHYGYYYAYGEKQSG
ncbi:MAG: polysaccharide biosynthesis tyrosine autokinase [Bryobacterales bacterium]